ncbi:hypothetical protein A2686_04870 [Candidatus Woesebacteria bacterium RIFCSPHIGHO2_01_FULL_38_10]|uniref:Glycosyltransferase RgtA/B/C/D-like domain-containing protein n=1 Tax=Candidatus Woesebacteria bacterium RIFCSPLOWO2_01_FULL_39_10b TaxID=1802517 RepID=A0A1F8B5R9_9BACT|nr:MAG: hypothetical protein A2686_04870 [Candidatus Woesebacteria bacterium RIFCSPHIGHO2_01_FULL_38_10]OGM59382.1 MAG: hypothetical protein A2892_03455 [Candidatus Woesebacteria bacterium RIFCSPLOWO2_01_FULL_39_10b]
MDYMEKDMVPKESETIAAKRAARLAEKIREGKNFVIQRTWWSNSAFEILVILSILSLNLYQITPFFGTSAKDSFYSGPVIPLLAKLIELFGISLSVSLQTVNIFFYSFFPLTFYLFTRKISGRKAVAVLASLFVILPFYPFSYVRVAGSLAGVDSPHIASLSITPIALLLFFSFLTLGKVNSLIGAAIASAFVALVSPFGFMIFLIFAFILTFSEMLLGSGRLKLVRAVSVFIFAAGLTSFWYNPVFFLWILTGPLGIDIRYTMGKLIPVSFFTLPVLGAFGYLLFDRKSDLQTVFLASFFTISFALISLAGGGIFPSHPSRYVAELGISLSFLLSVSLVKLVDYLSLRENKLGKIISQSTFSKMGLMGLFITLVLTILVYKDRLNMFEGSVLGIWEGIDKGSIWQAKERYSGGLASGLGYFISLISVLILGIVAKRSLGNISKKSGVS